MGLLDILSGSKEVELTPGQVIDWVEFKTRKGSSLGKKADNVFKKAESFEIVSSGGSLSKVVEYSPEEEMVYKKILEGIGVNVGENYDVNSVLDKLKENEDIKILVGAKGSNIYSTTLKERGIRYGFNLRL